jgi:hypothetical protein
MPHYFFDTVNGDNDRDAHGVELESDDSAVNEAVRFAGALMHDQPEILLIKSELAIIVRRQDVPLAMIKVQLANL